MAVLLAVVLVMAVAVLLVMAVVLVMAVAAAAILTQDPPANLPPPPNGDRRRRRNPQERRQLRNQQITIAGQAAGNEEVQHIDEIVAGGMRNRTRQVDNVDVLLDTISDSIVSVTGRLTSVLERARTPSTATASVADEIDRLYKRRKQAADARMDQAVAHCEQEIYCLQTLEINRLNTQYN